MERDVHEIGDEKEGPLPVEGEKGFTVSGSGKEDSGQERGKEGNGDRHFRLGKRASPGELKEGGGRSVPYRGWGLRKQSKKGGACKIPNFRGERP